MSDYETIVSPISDLVGSTLLIVALVIVGIAIPIGLAFIPANIAKKKGYSFVGFFVLGLFFFLIGLIVALCLDDRNAQVSQAVNAVHSSNGPANRVAAPSIADELQKLNNLLQQGAISQEEYDRLKSNLMNR